MTTHNEKNTAHSRRKLRGLFIEPDAQWRYAGSIIASVFLVTALLSIFLFDSLNTQARAKMLLDQSAVSMESTWTILSAALAFSFATAIAVGAWTFILTHRLLGPVKVVGGYLRQLEAGRFPSHRRLRKKDQLKPFYALFWRAVDTMKSARQQDLGRLNEMSELLSQARRGHQPMSAQSTEEIAKLVHEMQLSAASALREELPKPIQIEKQNATDSKERESELVSASK